MVANQDILETDEHGVTDVEWVVGIWRGHDDAVGAAALWGGSTVRIKDTLLLPERVGLVFVEYVVVAGVHSGKLYRTLDRGL